MVARSNRYEVRPSNRCRDEGALNPWARISRVSLSKCFEVGVAEIGTKVDVQEPITVHYDGQVVGIFTADLLVNDSLILELKANQLLVKAHEVQLVNHLVATGIDEALLVNFGAERLEYKKSFDS